MLLVFTTYLLVIWVLCETHFYYRGGNEHFLVGNSSLQSQKWPTEEDVLQPWQFIQLEITTQTFLNSRFGWLGRPLTVTNTTNRICHLQIHDPWRFCLCQSNKKWNFLEKYIRMICWGSSPGCQILRPCADNQYLIETQWSLSRKLYFNAFSTTSMNWSFSQEMLVFPLLHDIWP